MTDQTWQAAREALKEQVRIVAAGLDHPGAALAAADAYALTLAGQAVEYDINHNPPPECGDQPCCCAYHWLEARVKAVADA